MVLEALPPASARCNDFNILEDSTSVHYLNNAAKALVNQQLPLGEVTLKNSKSNTADISSPARPFSAEDQENSPQYVDSAKRARQITANLFAASHPSDQEVSKNTSPAAQRRRTVLSSPNHRWPGASSLASIHEDNPLATTSAVSNIQQQVEKHLAATPISAASTAQCFKSMQLPNEMAAMDISQPPPHFGRTALTVPEVTEAVQDALSPIPSPSIQSERSCIGAISPSGSLSGPRIEDSLEEIDKLEEELEAINEVTDFKGTKSSGRKAATPASYKLSATLPHTSRTLKRASMANLSPSARLGETGEPTLRRSTSLHLRPNTESSPGRNLDRKMNNGPASSQKAGFKRLPTSKSSKPPTVPKFELPGEAVARKLREQREARKLQQEQAVKMAMSPPKPLTLTKPCFELPGEAISRRKREEREAKLKIEEEEARKRREFKARPVRHSVGPNTIPKDTATSRARAAQIQQTGDYSRPTLSNQQKRMSIGPGVHLTSTKPLASSRSSLSSSTSATLSRQSTADSRTQGLAPTPSTTETAQKSLRRKSTFLETIHDVRQRERQEKEKAMKEAREQAAERSRIASRQWAEKQRRKDSSQN